ncbi:hypothetical protein [Serratia proteamaculans]|uniref:hypothetical protein n=1 Tax=Serratia proteamaculans TaxID=28151 RepID=UPI003CFF3F38
MVLIRLRGYNTGAQEYLEEGVKEGREHSRDELDERVILYGDLDLTRMLYERIPDHSQERYLSYTMSFKEDHVPYETYFSAVTEFKQFLLCAYKEHEINFYAEAHLPKIKQLTDRKTGELIDRKPHVHIIIPRKNLYNGNEANPGGMHDVVEKYMEAFQEYFNQKYNLASPRDNVRFDPTDSSSVLARYKGDDFYSKNREFKQGLVKQIVELDVRSRADFYSLVSKHGETRIRNEGKESEYIAVKLPGDDKFTNLKETIFQDGFIVNRELKKPPLDKKVIRQRLLEWPKVAKEIKYIHKATPAFRKLYFNSTEERKAVLLDQREQNFYQTHGEHNGGLHTSKRSRDSERGVAETRRERVSGVASGLQDVPVRALADDRQVDQQGVGALLLSPDARLHVGASEHRRDSGLRTPLRDRGRGTERRPDRAASLPAGATRLSTRATSSGAAGNRSLIPPYARNLERSATVADVEIHSVTLSGSTTSSSSPGQASGKPRSKRAKAVANSTIPLYARSKHRVATVQDIQSNSTRLFGPSDRPYEAAQARAGPVDSAVTEKAADSSPRPRRRSKSNRSKSAIPLYARNQQKVASVADIEKHSRRLFAVLTQSGKPPQVFKTQISKPILIPRPTSTVAASLSRSLEQSQLLPAQRKAIRRVDTKFFELRRFVYSDARLTRQDKAQLFSVLVFERLKAREAIKHPIAGGQGIARRQQAGSRQ